jgi:protein involved in polysaccharide export with SLBB domain
MRIAGLCLLVVVAGLTLCGCATRHEVDLSRLLRQLERGAAATNAPAAVGPDEPEPPSAPMAGLLTEEGVAALGEITIQPDSLVQVTVEEDPTLDGSYQVNEIGAVQLKYVGPVILYNKTEKQAEEKVREVLLGRGFKKATVKVRMLRASYDRVQMEGKINRPGIITIGAGDTISLYEALLRAGGLESTTRETKAQILRNGMLSPAPFAIQPEEYRLMQENGKPDIPTVYVRPNDIVRVLWADAPGAETGAAAAGGPRSILVLGEVNRPGFYTFEAGEPASLLRLILKLGGLPPYANAKAVTIIRRLPDGSEKTIKVNAQQLLETGDPNDDEPLEDGDRVKVPQRRISLF